MKIEFNTKLIGEHTGYGNAARLLKEALVNRGVEILPGSDIVLNFCMPTDYKRADISIGYTPWESTKIPESWVMPMYGMTDLWTTSDWCRAVFEENIRLFDIQVVPHGIEKLWLPKYRTPDGPFTWLHVGEPAVRKGGDIVLQAWHKHFRHKKDTRLVMKCSKYAGARVKDSSGSIIASPGLYADKLITKIMTPQELLDLYHSCNAMIYPTRGEGFGFIPLEAMATGMPTIFPADGGTGAFVPYSRAVIYSGKWVDSGHEVEHPGKWLDFDIDEIIHLMEMVMENYPLFAQHAYDHAFFIHQDYSWDAIANQVVTRIGKLLYF